MLPDTHSTCTKTFPSRPEWVNCWRKTPTSHHSTVSPSTWTRVIPHSRLPYQTHPNLSRSRSTSSLRRGSSTPTSPSTDVAGLHTTSSLSFRTTESPDAQTTPTWSSTWWSHSLKRSVEQLTARFGLLPASGDSVSAASGWPYSLEASPGA